MSNAIPHVESQSFTSNAQMLDQEIKTLSVPELLKKDLPPKEYMLEPVLPTKGLMMVHASRGTGKTFFVLSMAIVIATGSSFLGWKASKPRKVLIVDGEMATEDLKERLGLLVEGMGVDKTHLENLSIMASDYQEHGLPDLAHEEGRAAIEKFLERADVVIFDNISTLFPSLKENENDDAQSLMRLMLMLRRKRKSAVIVHHSGKNGQQRGGSRKEDLLNTVIGLKRASDPEDGQSCVVDIMFEKARGFFGDDAKTFRAALVPEEEKGLKWKVSDPDADLLDDILELKKQGLTQREIAKELDTNKTKVNRVLKKYKEKEEGKG